MAADNLPEECYAICAPDGPGTPFAGPWIIWFDIARIIVMVMGVICIVYTPRLILEVEARGQRARLLAQALFAMVVIGTEVDHIGDYAHYRLLISFAGIALMLWGLSQIRNEMPARTRSAIGKSRDS